MLTFLSCNVHGRKVTSVCCLVHWYWSSSLGTGSRFGCHCAYRATPSRSSCDRHKCCDQMTQQVRRLCSPTRLQGLLHVLGHVVLLHLLLLLQLVQQLLVLVLQLGCSRVL